MTPQIADLTMEEKWEQHQKKMALLHSQIVPYVHPDGFPPLPSKVVGSLHGIGIMYDEDRDDRILLAISHYKHGFANGKLYHSYDIIAASEHEGMLELYLRYPHDCFQEGIDIEEVCQNDETGTYETFDYWQVEQYIAFDNRWVIPDQKLYDWCIRDALQRNRDKFKPKKVQAKTKTEPTWQLEPATDKQIGYLRKLGYTGDAPKTKGDAGKLISEWSQQ